MNDKIAVVTEDRKRISSHFGMAPTYQVFTVSDGQIIAEEEREKLHLAQHPNHEEHHEGRHEGGHSEMFEPIRDCQVLICGGMGEPAYRKARNAGLEVVLTGGNLHSAVEAYLSGELISDLRRVHQH